MRPVSETKWIQCETSVGTLVFAARPELRERHKSVVLLIHDVMGSAEDLAPWFGRLEPEAEVVLATLPGHGSGPPLTKQGWEGMVGAFHQSLRTVVDGRRVLAAGAGLGGVLALGLNTRGYASVSFDPFFSTAKQWPLELGLQRAAGRNRQLDEGFLFDTLGWRDGAFVENRSYGELLSRLKAPALVVCGDVPLAPRRDMQAAPSLMDEADHALLAAHPDVRLWVAPGCGHNLLGQAPDLCRDLILDELARA